MAEVSFSPSRAVAPTLTGSQLFRWTPANTAPWLKRVTTGGMYLAVTSSMP